MALVFHRHGKDRVRLGRVWRDGARHTFVEWDVHVMLDSDTGHAYTAGSNQGVTATDTIKNTVYLVAKGLEAPCAPELFGLKLARHFVETYDLVSKASVSVEQVGWERLVKNGEEHTHGFVGSGNGIRTADVVVGKSDAMLQISGGVKGLKVLKTTQSGFEGFIQDEFTLLPETKERIMATSITSTWIYNDHSTAAFDDVFSSIKASLINTFFGPCDTGVYSPSVQFTLYQMGRSVLEKSPEIKSIYLKMPNLHFLPCNPVTSSFDNDVYVATSEPHGDIEATVERQ